MKITFTDTGAGQTAHIQIHPLVLKYQADKVADFAVRLMMETGIDSVTVTPA